MTHRAALAALLLTLAAGCASQAGSSDDPVATEAAASALANVPLGSFVIADEPFDSPYISRLTLSEGKRFDLEYVRRAGGFGSDEEKLAYTGKYSVFAGDPGETLISFDVEGLTDANTNLIFSVKATATKITLQEIGEPEIVLKKTSAAPEKTDGRVLHCDGRTITATITLDEAQRRRGHIDFTRKAGADNMDPPEGATAKIVYTGGTGVDDYMAYEGRDAAGNTYSFALKASDLRKTSGKTAEVGLGYGPNDFLAGGSEIHHTLDCTIARAD